MRSLAIVTDRVRLGMKGYEQVKEVNIMTLKDFVPHIDLKDIAEDLGVPGITAIVLLPVLIPAAGKAAKPLAKATIKGGIVLYEQGKGVIANVGETLEDLIAESQAELAEAKSKTLAPPQPEVAGT